MQGRDVRVQVVATIERTRDRREPVDLRIEFDGHTVTLAEIAVELLQWT